jgi:predicted Zn-dependent peptidase
LTAYFFVYIFCAKILTIFPITKSYTSVMASQIYQHTLSNGMILLTEEMPWLSSASFTFLLPCGAATEPHGQEGSSTVLNDWLYRGAGQYNSQQLSDALDDLGLRRGGGTSKEYTTLSGSLLASNISQALSLYADIIRKPHLSESEFEPARNLAQQELASLGDNPTQQLFETLSSRYFVSSHNKSTYGTPEGLEALTPDSVRSDYAQRIAPRGTILSIAGGVHYPEILEQVEKHFGDWSGTPSALPEVAISKSRQEHITQDTSQVQIGVAYEAFAPSGPGWYENALAIGVLSGGMGARLFSEVREKRGLVYSVSAGSRTLKNFGYTLGYAGTTTERANETLSVLLHELRNMSQGITQDELERSRTGLLSQLVMQGESSGARASAMARDVFLLGSPRPIEDIKQNLTRLSLNQVNDFLSGYHPSFTVLTLGSEPLSEVALS